jgi:hypothetical protein
MYTAYYNITTSDYENLFVGNSKIQFEPIILITTGNET